MNSTREEIGPITWFIIAIIGIVALSGLFGSRSSSSSSYTSPAPASTSADYRYVEKRMQLEGMSQSDARQAADAVMKFHAAQKAKQR